MWVLHFQILRVYSKWSQDSVPLHYSGFIMCLWWPFLTACCWVSEDFNHTTIFFNRYSKKLNMLVSHRLSNRTHSLWSSHSFFFFNVSVFHSFLFFLPLVSFSVSSSLLFSVSLLLVLAELFCWCMEHVWCLNCCG